MAHILLKDQGDRQEHYPLLEKFPRNWNHYSYNQFGYTNRDEAIDHFNLGFGQLSLALKHGQCNVDTYIAYLQNLQQAAGNQIEQLKQKQDP